MCAAFYKYFFSVNNCCLGDIEACVFVLIYFGPNFYCYRKLCKNWDFTPGKKTWNILASQLGLNVL